MNLQNIAIGFAYQRHKLGIIEPRRQRGDDKTKRMNSLTDAVQPAAICAQIFLRAVKIDLEFAQCDAMTCGKIGK